MALSRAAKVAIVQDLIDQLKPARLTVLVNYRGSSVGQLQKLRQLEPALKIRVIKNRLLELALKQVRPGTVVPLEGMMMIVSCDDDEVLGPQTIAGFIRQDQVSLVMIGAWAADGSWFGPDQLKRLSRLPNRAQSLTQLIDQLTGPLSRISGDLNSQLSRTLAAVQAGQKT